jgi:hypothetical protein
VADAKRSDLKTSWQGGVVMLVHAIPFRPIARDEFETRLVAAWTFTPAIQ